MTPTLMTLGTLLVSSQAFVPINNSRFISQPWFDHKFHQEEKLRPLRYRNDDIIPLVEHGTSIISSEIHTNYQERQLKTKYDLKWEQQFQELQEYFNEHGDYDVPNKVNGRLSRWIASQRRAYKSGTITQQRYHALHSIQFPWSRKTRGNSDSGTPHAKYKSDNDLSRKRVRRKVAKRTPWIERFYQLKEFRKRHGHCIVPQHYAPNPGLGIWVKSQRRQYKIHKSSSKSNKRCSRIEKLDSIGFVWDVITKDKTESDNQNVMLKREPKPDQDHGYVIPIDFENKTSQQLHSAWKDRFNEFR